MVGNADAALLFSQKGTGEASHCASSLFKYNVLAENPFRLNPIQILVELRQLKFESNLTTMRTVTSSRLLHDAAMVDLHADGAMDRDAVRDVEKWVS